MQSKVAIEITAFDFAWATFKLILQDERKGLLEAFKAEVNTCRIVLVANECPRLNWCQLDSFQSAVH